MSRCAPSRPTWIAASSWPNSSASPAISIAPTPFSTLSSDLDPTTGVGVALFRQLVRAEQSRQQYRVQGSPPAFLAKPDPISEMEMRAAVLLRAGDTAGAAALIEQRDAARAPVAGVADGVAFDDFRDLDDLSAGHLEILTSTGKYYWVPVSSVISIEFRAPERQRDLIWRRAHLSVADGPDGEVYMPCIYEIPRPQQPGATPRPRYGFPTGDEARAGSGVGAAEFPCWAKDCGQERSGCWAISTASAPTRRAPEGPRQLWPARR